MRGPSEDRRVVSFVATEEFLADWLQLPPGAYIDRVEDAPEHGCVRFYVRGMGCPVKLGAPIPQIKPTITQHVVEVDGVPVTRNEIHWAEALDKADPWYGYQP